MKKLIVSLLVLILTLCLFGSAYAGTSGNVIVPGISLKHGPNTQLMSSSIELSNITGHDVQVTVDLYDQDGELVKGKSSVYKGSNTSISMDYVTTLGNTFTLPAHATRSIQFYKASGTYNIHGYAVVSWDIANGVTTKALVGKVFSGSWYNNQFLGWANTLINNGQPF